jgi:hypothetical protein
VFTGREEITICGVLFYPPWYTYSYHSIQEKQMAGSVEERQGITAAIPCVVKSAEISVGLP